MELVEVWGVDMPRIFFKDDTGVHKESRFFRTDRNDAEDGEDDRGVPDMLDSEEFGPWPN